MTPTPGIGYASLAGCAHHWHLWLGRLSNQRECCKCYEVKRA